MNPRSLEDRITGFVMGAAVGDAIGLPREGISRRRARRMFGDGPLGHQMWFGRGMISDDTEHLVITALSLIDAQLDATRFLPALSWRLRLWLACIPAGIGLATARSIMQLWLGWSPERSGVYSAGNGPAMRSGLLGLCIADSARLKEIVRQSTRITHTDSKAETGALAVAIAVRFGLTEGLNPTNFPRLLSMLREISSDFEWASWLDHVTDAVTAGENPEEFSLRIGSKRGIRGYMYETVAAALYCWSGIPYDFRKAVEQAVILGGDTDTVAAVVGGLVGATSGVGSIPNEWLSRLVDWPLSVRRLRELAVHLAQLARGAPIAGNWDYPNFASVPRNLVFLGIVLAHGFRRLLPPY